MAEVVGGKVVAMSAFTPSGPIVQNHPNQMVQTPDGRLINAGIIASYYDCGRRQGVAKPLVDGEISKHRDVEEKPMISGISQNTPARSGPRDSIRSALFFAEDTGRTSHSTGLSITLLNT